MGSRDAKGGFATPVVVGMWSVVAVPVFTMLLLPMLLLMRVVAPVSGGIDASELPQLEPVGTGPVAELKSVGAREVGQLPASRTVYQRVLLIAWAESVA